MDNKEKLKVLKELKKRQDLKEYEADFEKFAIEQLRIITKDASQGFVSFSFKRCPARD